MFDIGWSEFVLIGIVALIVIGPKELPAVLRAVGQWTTKIRRMASEFQSQFQEAMREAEMADLKKEVDKFSDTAKGFTSDFDPINLEEATRWQPKAEAAAGPSAPPASSPAAPSDPAPSDPAPSDVVTSAPAEPATGAAAPTSPEAPAATTAATASPAAPAEESHPG